jgi:hypothetical protein
MTKITILWTMMLCKVALRWLDHLPLGLSVLPLTHPLPHRALFRLALL